ncbi:MAG: DNA-directed DNA polymerase II small subunit [Candidatus Bathyarchaeota archaeon]|uniref:DNA-directed DNA polymerase II small subunit n=1 Tax=Candidatus Bathycorpusculum sp. TaxID=2994959 RepID=UPI00281BFEA2|nr:DNA-directed DNA polymerase II small subunit [Candidatus Termiticorpusculum sp.]MCL2258173.1 DNA-directed DNA polymerase II small subunit [Candidatus Termiticorpusculum sp.]MCL2291510.1 DNA-directed DNA polymerase II small subunit [Candidatus Termiticorpusculum sp.]
MKENERLQKAIEATITAGYQLDNEAFNYLCHSCEGMDPLAVMNMVFHEINNLKEKPFFIEKNFLENMVKQLTQTHQAAQATQSGKNQFASQTSKNANPTEAEQRTQYTKTQQPQFKPLPIIDENIFYPYAKYIPSELKILEDATGKLTSNGTLEEYITLFQDRYKRIEKILRQRIDVKAATPIREALKSQPKTKLKIICMLTEKKDNKQQTILSVEDLDSNATVLVPNKAPDEVKKKALQILPDQVICIAVIKTKSNLFLAEDIIFPDVGQKTIQKAQEPVYAVLTSDIHVGSTKFNKEAFKKFILWLKGKYGTSEMRKIAGYVKYLLVAGDIVDGVGIYPGQQFELTIRDVHKQYDFAIKYLEKIPNYIEIVLAPGNHDTSRKALPQPAIPSDYLTAIEGKTNIHSVGNPCLVNIHGINVLMDHGRSLDDIIAVVPGMSHTHPEKSMRLLLQGRHLAPVYGGKTMLSPENRDYLVIDKVPDILHAGHVHVLGYCNYKGVLVVNSGGWQEQTDYMEKLGLVPTPGKVPVINLMTMEITVLDFKTEN